MAPIDPIRNDDTSDNARTQASDSRSMTAPKPIVRHVREAINDYSRYEASVAASDTGSIRMPIAGLPLRESGDVAAGDDESREDENSLTDNGDTGSIRSSRSATDATSSNDISSMSHTGSMHNEASPLLPHELRRNEDPAADIDHKWDEAGAAGKIQTSWRTEAKVLARRSPPLIILAFLQWSLPMSGVFTAGRLGKIELGAISLGSTTASITCYATYQGLVTSLDTLCAQAYGSGKRELVGLQTQRTVLFLWCVTILVGALWLCSTYILEAIVPHNEREVAQLAGLYLKILLCGAPAFAAFEAGKRYLLAQGIFAANLYILLFCAPLNAFMSWLFVWQFKWGFVGAPIAIVITDYLLIICLVLYVRFVEGSECWGGFDRRAFKNWGPIIWLTIPGLVMTMAEYLAFEILTLAASWISTSHLAAQAVLATVIPLMYQGPMSVSISGSTRIANLIGAGLPGSAKTAAKIMLIAAFFIGCTNSIVLLSLKDLLPRLFTPDEDVRRLVSNVIPICVAFQVYDAIAASCNGILRGIGRQRFGGWVCLLSYYAVGIPISFGAGFGLHWDLYGLWAGPAIALLLVAFIEGFYLYHNNWERVVEEAKKRNSMG